MKILDLIHQLAVKEGIEFMLIGGHAINAIGDRRQTRDIDFVACENDKDKWKALLSGLDYQLFNESNAFLQFKPGDISQWPVDIMLVNQDTFLGLMADANTVNLGGQEDILIPSAEHLVAMKLHAFKQGDPVRKTRDLADIISLIHNSQMDINGKRFRELCIKYATEAEYEEIINLYRS